MTSPHDRPDAVELIETVGQFLAEEVISSVEGQLAFHVRVAVNALRMAAREIKVWDKINVANPRYTKPYTTPEGRERLDDEPKSQ